MNLNINELMKNNRERLINLVCELVKIPTENRPPDGGEKEGQKYFKKLCQELNLKIDEFRPDEVDNFDREDIYLKGRNYNQRRNVVATWSGESDGKSLILSGHMDVVPKEPMPWNVCKPFDPVIKDNKIYGRGTADMKGGLAAAFMAVRLLKESGWKPDGDIIIESVVDEEYAGGNGTIASRFKGYNGDFAINLESSGLKICPGAVGGLVYKVKLQGIAGMPYTGEEIYNPVYGLAKIIKAVKNYGQYRQENIKAPELWKESVQKIQCIITKVKAGEVQEHGQLSIPIDSWLEVVIQTYPGEKEDIVTEDFKKYLNKELEVHLKDVQADLIVEQEYHYIEPVESDKNFAGVKVLKECADSVLERPAVICGAPFSCDLFAFKKYGKTNAVIFGPVGGNLHAPDEWVDIDSLTRLTKILMQFIVRWGKNIEGT